MRSLPLYLRTLLGWGEHPDTLQKRHDLVMRALPGYIGLCLALLALIPGFLYLEGLSVHHVPSLARVLRVAAPMMFFATLMMSISPFPAIAFRILARRGARSAMTSIYGRCFEALDVPGRLFARIGLTRETAQWYALPLDWDEVVEPGDAEYEVTMNPGSGWVERVRRLGAEPRELVQEVPVFLTADEVRAIDRQDAAAIRTAQEAGATKEERIALKRFARAQKLRWRATPGQIAACAWSFIVFGVLLGVGWFVFVIVLIAPHPRSLRQPGAFQIIVGSVGIFGAFGLASVLFGLYYLRAWWRLRPLRHEEPTKMTGEIVAWLPYRDSWSPRSGRYIKETLIKVRGADGTSHIFRIPVKYAHRVRERGRTVRVEYEPTTERVVDVRRVDMPSSEEQGGEEPPR